MRPRVEAVAQIRQHHDALRAIRLFAGAIATAVIAATHDERLVADFAARRIEMADGWIVADEVYERLYFAGACAPSEAVRATRASAAKKLTVIRMRRRLIELGAGSPASQGTQAA